TEISQETMLEVLLWLNRFDLDGKQITTRRLRRLVENNKMPLRTVDRVDYDGVPRGHLDPRDKPSTLSIHPEKYGPAKAELPIETDADAETAASYLSSCFVRRFSVYGHHCAFSKNAIIAAPELIRELDFCRCIFHNAAENTLGKTLDGSTFQSLSLVRSSIPVWQIVDERLESLRLRGCNKIYVRPDDDDTKFEVTEECILSFCFTLDAGLPVPEGRSLEITPENITPAFFEKVVEASKSSPLTCDIKLSLGNLRFDVRNLDLGVLPLFTLEYDPDADMLIPNVRYDIADHGNGVRLLIHFKSEGGNVWDVTIRHGKDREEFFEPSPYEEEYEQEYWEGECDEGHDQFADSTDDWN
ncbi:hypothetical protein AAVH_30350, partial [Aphelenchoides avenae]